MKKYELIKSDIKGLYRIRALKSFSDVQEGEVGGYVENESNLSQEGDCWIYENARVYGKAEICGTAKVYGNVEVYGNAEVYGYARVYGKARVYENATVYGKAEIYENAEVYGDTEIYREALVKDAEISKGKHVGDVSEDFDKILYIQCDFRLITIYKKNGVQYCNIGCQQGMTLERLKERIKEDGGMTPHRQQYVDLMEQIKL